MMRNLPLTALATATIASVGGTRLSAIAIPWLVLTATNDPVLTGIVGMVELLPYVLAKALSGPVIDRLGARRIAVWCDAFSAVAIAMVPVLFWVGALNIWVLLPAVAIVGLVRAPADIAKQALVPVAAELGNMPLERVTGILGASNRLAGTLGAAGAGALISVVGPVPALLVNALSFIVSSLAVLVGIPDAGNEERSETAGSYRADWVAGWRTLRAEPVLLCMVFMIAFTNLFDQAYATVLLPVWVREQGLDVSWVGSFLAVFSGTAILGAMIAAALGGRLPRLPIYTLGFLCAGPVPYSVFALGAPLPVILGTLALSGFASGFLNPIIGALMFERIPRPMVGRVVALVGSITWVLMPFGGVYAGLIIDRAGIFVALAVTGFFYFLATMLPVMVPSFRQMDRRRTVTS